MRLTWLILGAILLAAPVRAQEGKEGHTFHTAKIHAANVQAANDPQTPNNEESSSQSGNFRGRIEGPLSSGEIKPVPFANVYLLYTSTYGKARTPEKEKTTTAGVFYGVQILQHLLEQEGLIQKHEVSESSQDPCWTLGASFESLKATLNWASGNAPEQVLQTKANEAGEFRFADVPPGLWYIVAGGNVENAATVWEGFIPILQNKTMVLELAEPEATCPISGTNQNPD